MPTRIYALAKDLKLDSKELVDLCTKAGIPGKGSALASLEDDEVVKLKSYLEGHSKRPASSPSAAPPVNVKAVLSAPVSTTALTPPPPPRPTVGRARPGSAPAVESSPFEESTSAVAVEEPPVVAAEAKTVELPPPPVVKQPASPPVAKAPVVETPEPVVSVPEVAPPPPVSKAVPASKPAPAAPEPPAAAPPTVSAHGKTFSTPAPTTPSTAPHSAVPQRGDPLGMRGRGAIRVIGAAGKKKEAEAKTGEGAEVPAKPATKGPERRGPAVRVAAMPEVRQPQPVAKVNEPQAQKPVMRIPTEALKDKRGQGAAPLKQAAEQANAQRKAREQGEARKPGAMPMPAEGAGSGKGGRGKGRPGEGEGLGDIGSVRAERQKQRTSRGKVQTGEDDDDSRRRRGLVRIKKHGGPTAPRKEKVELELPCTVREFCEQTGVGAASVLRVLMNNKIPASINGQIPEQFVELLAAELGLDITVKQPPTPEEVLEQRFASEDEAANLEPRPPIVTVLGHVDHGKTSLLDKLIGINVVKGEAGGITQHIRAYSVPTPDGRRVAFVDTPGHEAFTEMRARGANVTDIAVLVVAADDGVMPQTEEAISHAKAAGVPIVVAMNKIDLPGAQPDKVFQQLATAGLLPSEWGGDVEVIRTSAITGEGLDTLLETLLVTAELHDYRANPNRPAMGMCLEAEQEAGRGVIAKVMVQNGTLREGDIIVCGAGHGRVKAMYDTLRPREQLESAGPSTPVNVTGLDVAPEAGDRLYVVQDISEARELASRRASQTRQTSLSGGNVKMSFEDFQKRLSEGRLHDSEDVSTLNLIIRADVRGSIEAIVKELGKFEHPEVKVKVLQASVGGITVADVTLAHASDAVIVGFNVIPDEAARALADDRGVEIRRYDIIYKLTDDIKAILEGKLKPEERIVELGRALVKQAFAISRVGTVAGCQVIQGSIERGCRVRVNRENRTIGDYGIDTLRREKDDVKEVSRGMECGIKLQNFNDIKEGDVLEAYRIEEVARTL
ncbi:Translation initiation factor IF-2 [Anatilimnocola aggregata]|uniref:Translation initiation factor IF-2 n=1 Tax=Anatilimnocola aggregata TaxID=2528021 RepID=A0A517Y9N8_9BACT|nr:translation initiation factor IF-2 [Anatilimnocola aggregata]QDU26944.1 Translation initiation factor IF-2 [Anatilimnocola aggregata]